MIRIRIGDVERELGSADENWINQQINRRQADGLSVCVRVIVKEGDLDMILSTPACGPSEGGSRPPRSSEKTVFNLWNQRGLSEPDFTGGNLIAFLKQLRHIM
ncbi:MAG: hypothetical protein A2156_15470 [Deltaproteobacteria bacterium RBG_16_48_10]|nr:MAG: hypothetical protein A2156_15470 [Deltaproteobacteria bacterium RBG_16_48_10]OHE18280.1 MAG: hypothetical protein A2X96_12525 [Syntrophobacterales bacterium GWC2_56_13]